MQTVFPPFQVIIHICLKDVGISGTWNVWNPAWWVALGWLNCCVWDQPRDQLSFNYATWKLSKCINMREEDFLRVGVELADVVVRVSNPYHGKKREKYGKDKCGQLVKYTNQCDKDPQCKPCKLLPVPVTPTLCPENKTEMTQTEVYSHFLNVCNQEVVPSFTFPTPLDDPKFHEGQKCVDGCSKCCSWWLWWLPFRNSKRMEL